MAHTWSGANNFTGTLTKKGSTVLAASDVVNGLSSTAANLPLSANQGKVLNERINAISGIGRFLSGWDCSTGLPTTNPEASPYIYPTGAFYIVAKVGETNYKPSGIQYTIGEHSVDVESSDVKVGDVYKFDGTVWELISMDSPAVAEFTNETSGTIRGKQERGYVEADGGFGKVCGFDELTLTEITWQELYALREKKELVPGMQYRITDYVPVTSS